MAQGQTISTSGSGSSLGFLTAANSSPESGTGTICYTDGTTQSFTLNVGNFWCSSGHTVYVFEQSVPLAAGKTVEAVTLPAGAASPVTTPLCISSPCRFG